MGSWSGRRLETRSNARHQHRPCLRQNQTKNAIPVNTPTMASKRVVSQSRFTQARSLSIRSSVHETRALVLVWKNFLVDETNATCVSISKFTIHRYQKTRRLSSRAVQLPSYWACAAASASNASLPSALFPGVGSNRIQEFEAVSNTSAHAWVLEFRTIKLLLNLFQFPPRNPVTIRAGNPVARAIRTKEPAKNSQCPASSDCIHRTKVSPEPLGTELVRE